MPEPVALVTAQRRGHVQPHGELAIAAVSDTPENGRGRTDGGKGKKEAGRGYKGVTRLHMEAVHPSHPLRGKILLEVSSGNRKKGGSIDRALTLIKARMRRDRDLAAKDRRERKKRGSLRLRPGSDQKGPIPLRLDVETRGTGHTSDGMIEPLSVDRERRGRGRGPENQKTVHRPEPDGGRVAKDDRHLEGT